MSHIVDTQVLLNDLFSLADKYNVRSVADEILADWRFPRWPGSATPIHHHCRRGGLIEHTHEVVHLCLANNELFPEHKRLPADRVFLAALFHDIGKIYDYGPVDENYDTWINLEHKKNIHHISRSALIWHKASERLLSIEVFDDVLHAILAHHGCREWGSPVTPNSKLAWLLHLCDSLSARFDDVGIH